MWSEPWSCDQDPSYRPSKVFEFSYGEGRRPASGAAGTPPPAFGGSLWPRLGGQPEAGIFRCRGPRIWSPLDVAKEGGGERTGSPPDSWLGVSGLGDPKWNAGERSGLGWAERNVSMGPASCPCGIPLLTGSSLGSEFPGTTLTNFYKPGGLKPQKCAPLSWRLEV